MPASGELGLDHFADAVREEFLDECVIRGEAHQWAGAGHKLHGDPVRRAQAVDELRRRRQDVAAVALVNVALVDDEKNQAAGLEALVRAELRAFRIDAIVRAPQIDEFRGREAPRLAVDFENEVFGLEIVDGFAVLVDGGDIDRDQIDAGLEGRLLRCGRDDSGGRRDCRNRHPSHGAIVGDCPQT